MNPNTHAFATRTRSEANADQCLHGETKERAPKGLVGCGEVVQSAGWFLGKRT